MLAAPARVISQPWVAAKVETLRVELVESGEIGAVKSTTVAAPQIWSLDMQIIDMAPEGVKVDSGDVLVEFDKASLLANLEEKQAELALRRAELERLRAENAAKRGELARELEQATFALKLAELRLAQLQFESDLRKEDGRLELLKAQIARNEAETKFNAQQIINESAEKKQQLLVFQAEGEVRQARREIEQLTLRAPLSGLVVYHTHWDGSKPQIGGKAQPGQGMIDLPDLRKMQVKIGVNEVDISAVRPGLRAVVTLDAFPDRQFNARVVDIASIAQPRERDSQVRVFAVVLEIAGQDSLLKPGMTAQVRIELAQLPGALILPIGCVYEIGGAPVVFTRASPHKAHPIELAGRNDFWAAVRGLAEGTEVAYQPGDLSARPLGFAAYQRTLVQPDSVRQRQFTDMAKRHLSFDYDAFRSRPQAQSGEQVGSDSASPAGKGAPLPRPAMERPPADSLQSERRPVPTKEER